MYRIIEVAGNQLNKFFMLYLKKKSSHAKMTNFSPHSLLIQNEINCKQVPFRVYRNKKYIT